MQYNEESGVCLFRRIERSGQFIPAKSLPIPKEQKDKQRAEIESCYEYFSGLPEADRNQINENLENYYACKVLDTHKEKVYRFMFDRKLWPQTY